MSSRLLITPIALSCWPDVRRILCRRPVRSTPVLAKRSNMTWRSRPSTPTRSMMKMTPSLGPTEPRAPPPSSATGPTRSSSLKCRARRSRAPARHPGRDEVGMRECASRLIAGQDGAVASTVACRCSPDAARIAFAYARMTSPTRTQKPLTKRAGGCEPARRETDHAAARSLPRIVSNCTLMRRRWRAECNIAARAFASRRYPFTDARMQASLL